MSNTKYTPRLAKRFLDEITPALKTKFNFTSVMQVPRLTKICLNQGVNGATSDKKLVDIAVQEMTAIAGQKAVASHARMAISNFKLREGSSPRFLINPKSRASFWANLPWLYNG